MSKLKVFLLLLIVSTTGIDARALRKRRGIWPDVLAPGGNTFATSGYFNMQSYIAYPESGIAFNPYWQGYYPQNQFNNLNPYGYNQPYPYGIAPGIVPGTAPGIVPGAAPGVVPGPAFGGIGINNGLPYGIQGNYNGYYPNQPGPFLYPPGRNGPLRSGIVYARTGSNIGERSPVERTN